MSVFEAKAKPGRTVGLRIASMDEQERMLADLSCTWYGWDEKGEQETFMGLVNGVYSQINQAIEGKSGG